MITVLFALATVAVDPASKPAPAASAAATTAVIASTDAAPAQPAAARRYCINDTLTGTRMAKKVCLTRQEWQRRGVDLQD